jgi:phosphate/sulfate permease
MALAVILFLYIGIGFLAAGGSIAVSTRWFSAKWEQVFYGLLLSPIAALYLAFTTYFAANGAWRLEAYAIVAFTLLGLVGTRLSGVLMLGYALHGAWDLLHEGFLRERALGRGVTDLTTIPLAYGAFCAAFDWFMVGYFNTRRTAWRKGWQG